MNKHLLLLAACGFALSAAAGPAAPTNLKATAYGPIVTLSWDWGGIDGTVSETGFEESAFPPEGWSIRTTNTAIPISTWFHYPDYMESAEEFLLNGDYSALVAIDTETGLHQDEWLVVNPGVGAEYMDFKTFLAPQVIEAAQMDADFPDHYYVKISRDNGETWRVLWDGCEDAALIEDLQGVALFLGAPADENTLVAFNAVSGEEDSLYTVWSVDDVVFYSAQSPLTAEDGDTYFMVYLDDELIAGKVTSRSFQDLSDKSEGIHTYRVVAYSEDSDTEWPGAEIEVTVEQLECAAPQNAEVYYDYDADSDRYEIEIVWDAPDDERQPAYYNVYSNGVLFASYVEDELSAGQSGMYKGVYTYEVEAVYELPDGVSERVGGKVAPGTRFDVENLRLDGNALSWEKPQESEFSVSGYNVYRGSKLLAENISGNSYTDEAAPAGIYNYNVRAVYSDGELSLPVSVKGGDGSTVTYQMPLFEDFSGNHLPADWQVSKPEASVKEMYLWRFDNWFDLQPGVDNFDSHFASISSQIAGFSMLESALVSPAIEFPADKDAFVDFDLYYESPEMFPGVSFNLEYSSVGGQNWDNIYDFIAQPDGSGNGHQRVDITPYVTGTTSLIRFNYKDRLGKFCAIDNVKISSDPASVDLTPADTATPETYYNLQGVRVNSDTLAPGLYLRRHGAKTTKILVK